MNEYQQWTCDVLVIGAGPAGSAAARFAARKGVSVILLERREKVGLPVRCAEYVPLPISQYVELNRPGILVQAVRAMQTFIPGDSVKETAVPGAMINRDRLDQELADLAVKAGALLKTGTQAWTRQGDQVVARGKEGLIKISSRVIIGADGPSSQVVRWMGNGHKEFLIAAPVPGFPKKALRPYAYLFLSLHPRRLWMAFSERKRGQPGGRHRPFFTQKFEENP